MIVSLVNGNKKTPVNPQPTTTTLEDNVVKMKNYTIKFSGNLNYSQDGEVIYISDDKNYTFSYRNSLDDYERYSKDLTILENSLKKSGYNVLNSEKREVNETEFIIYKFKFDSNVKYLYVTKIDKKYITMGTIEEVSGGDWREALTVINKINNTIKLTDSGDSDSEINNALDNSTMDNGEDDKFLMGLMLVNKLHAPKMSDEDKKIFSEKLSKFIDEEVNKYGRCTISCDYHQEGILAKLSNELNISDSLFPIKTVMWISEDSIQVRAGYSANTETIYKA